MRIGMTITLSFAAIIALFGTSLYMSQSAVAARKDAGSQRGISTLKDLTKRFQNNFKAASMGLRGFLLTNEQTFLDVYDSAIADNGSIINQLAHEFGPDSEQRIVLDDITEIQAYWVSEYSAPLIAAKRSTDTSLNAQQDFKRQYQGKITSGVERDVLQSIQSKFRWLSNSVPTSPIASLTHESQMSSLISRQTTVLLSSIILACGIAGWSISSITSRMKRILAISKAISEGNLNVKFDQYAKNEFNEIMSSLVDISLIVKSYSDTIRKQRIELDELTHILLYDVKLPLNNIQSTIYSLLANPVCTSSQVILKQIFEIEAKASKAEEAVTDVTTFGIEGKRKPGRELLGVTELVDEIRTFIPASSEITILTHGTLPVLYGDRSLFEQVLINMVLNAVTYPPNDAIEVLISCKKRGSYYHLFVQHALSTANEALDEKIPAEGMAKLAPFAGASVGISVLQELMNGRGLDIRMSIESGRKFVFCLIWPQKKTA